MSAVFIYKIILGLLLLAILISLGSGMLFLVKDKGKSRRTLHSLSVRIALSVTLFIMLFIGYVTGLIQPHGVTPEQTEKALPQQRLPVNN